MALVNFIDANQLASIVQTNLENVLIIDGRSFMEFNVAHILHAVNVCSSKIVKRRLQQEKISIREFLLKTCNVEIDKEIVVYAQDDVELTSVTEDSFIHVLVSKLIHTFKHVKLLKGGFIEFRKRYPSLCEVKTQKCVPISLSQPCLPISSSGPTRILPFIYLGSQQDAMNKDIILNRNITHELNVSVTCPKADIIPDCHFLRISVNDNYNERLLPYFELAFQFIDNVRKMNGCILIHCLAGISRSPTIAIAYIMRHMKMKSDDAYRYVKSKRMSVSPNFNFLGQLLEYENQLKSKGMLKQLTPKEAWRFKHCATNSTCTNINFGNLNFDSAGSQFRDIIEDKVNVNIAKAIRFVKSKSTSDIKRLRLAGVAEIDNVRNDEIRLENVKGLPLSALRTLSFTPCKASDVADRSSKIQIHSSQSFDDGISGSRNSIEECANASSKKENAIANVWQKYSRLTNGQVLAQRFGESNVSRKDERLYRANSCPGILGFLHHSSFENCNHAAALLAAGVSMRTVRNISPCEQQYRARNRHSCGSLEFVTGSVNFAIDPCLDFGTLKNVDHLSLSPARRSCHSSSIKVV